MKKQEILDAKKQKYIFYQVSLALKYIHENNIIHRDIKLDNILVDENDWSKICDFGVSCLIKEEEIIKE